MSLAYLAALLSLAGWAGYYPHLVSRLLGFLFLSAFALSGPGLARSGRGLLLHLGRLSLCAGVLIDTPWTAVVLPPVLLLVMLRSSPADRRDELLRLLRTSVLFALACAAPGLIPEVRAAVDWLGHAGSRVLGLVLGRDPGLGPTLMGLPVTLLVLCHMAAGIAQRARGAARHLIAAAAGVLAGSLGFHLLVEAAAFLLNAWPGAPLPLRIFALRNAVYTPFANFLRMHLGLVHLLMCWPALLWLGRRLAAPASESVAPRRGAATAAIVGLTAAAVLSIGVVPGAGRGEGRVHIYERGRFDWDLPTFEAYGGKSVGMFGLLPRLLRAIGFSVTIGGVAPDDLLPAETLVMINLRDPLTDAEIESVRSFVASGRTLIALGDHTRYERDDPYNALLAGTGVQFRFDTAQPMRMGWIDSLDIPPLAYPRLPRREYRIHHWVGASLAVDPSIRPLLLGRYGFSDDGEEAAIAMNKLGDRRHRDGERLGDLVLAAEARLGRGRILVFGDTTTFQNRQLMQTWTHARDILLSACAAPAKRAPSLLALALWLALVIVYVRAAPAAASMVQAFPPLALAGFLLLNQAALDRAVPVPVLPPAGSSDPIALIDLSHGERLSLDASQPDAIDGLGYNLMRNGYVPLVVESDLGARLEHARLVVITAPAHPFRPGEVESLRRFAAAGGLLVLASGWPESTPIAPLIETFGCSVENVPLGRVEADLPRGTPAFYSAWPVVCEPNPEVEGKAATGLFSVFGHDVAQYRPWGQGGVVVIGDSQFLQAHILEESGRDTARGFRFHVSLANVLFLRDLFARFGGAAIGS